MTPDIQTSPIIVDIETAGLHNALEFLEPVTPDARLVDPKKIEASIKEKEEARLAKLALDRNVGRIVAIGWWTEEEGTHGVVCRTEDEERIALRSFWNNSRHRTIVGFNCKGFDLPFMVQRSRYLGIPYPWLDLGKYTRKGVIDLYLDLTFNEGAYDQGAMRRTLKMFAKRFGLPVNDEIDGKEIPALVAEGKWDDVAAHCRADVELTVQLAHKLGVVREVPVPVDGASQAMWGAMVPNGVL
jgi:predicted PolB exonuclease-like 3'-5' exonuclease